MPYTLLDCNVRVPHVGTVRQARGSEPPQRCAKWSALGCARSTKSCLRRQPGDAMDAMDAVGIFVGWNFEEMGAFEEYNFGILEISQHLDGCESNGVEIMIHLQMGPML